MRSGSARRQPLPDGPSEVGGHRLGCDLAGVGDGACLRAAVGLDEQPVESEDRRAAILLPVGDVLQLPEPVAEHGQAQLPAQRRVVGVVGQLHHRLRDALEHLEADVAHEAVAADDVGSPLGDVHALHVAHEADARVLDQPGVGLHHPRRTLGGLGAVGEESHRGVGVLADDAGVGRAHDGEDHEVLGRGVHRGAHVEDEAERILLAAVPGPGRVDAGEGGAPHAGDELERPGAGQHAGAGVPRADHRVGLALGHQAGGDEDRGVGRATEGLGGLLVHADEVGGVVNADALAAVAGLGQDRVDLLRVAHQERVDMRRLERERGGALDDLRRPVVASHDVEGDGGCSGRHGRRRTVPWVTRVVAHKRPA